jgi:DNA-binding PadR family transcriptional regulator
MAYGKPITQTPLKPAVFHILLALSRGQLHGLGIADAVEQETGGEIQIGPGTLYRSLRDMAEAGIVGHIDDPHTDDPRRTYYELSESGRELLTREAQRLADLVEIARSRAVLPRNA